LAGSER
jgi:hypothetical protein